MDGSFILGLVAVAFIIWLFVIFPAWVTYDARYNMVNRHRAPGFWRWYLEGATEPADD